MPSQNNTGRQYDKQHSVTIVAGIALAANRFVAYDGTYPTAAGGAKASQGVSVTAAEVDQAVELVTGYSYLVTAAAAIPFGSLVAPDATGQAVVGTLTNHCGRALGAATQAGQLIEVQLYRHTHA
jgi:hypothetical protein